MLRIALVFGLISSLVPVGLAHADNEDVVQDAPTFHDYPTRFARRPLVLNQGMIRADGRLTVAGVSGPGTFSSFDLGGAVSPVENLELGLSTELTGAIPASGGIGLISIIFSPNASYGDIPVYARYQFYEGEKDFLAAVDLVLVLPTNTDFTLTVGLPMRVLELFDLFTIDMNLNFTYRNGDKFAGLVSDPSNNTMDFTFSGAAIVNLTDHGFLEIGGGIGVVNINGGTDANNVLELPFFLGGGYTLQRKILLDLFAQFGWNPLMTVNGPPGTDTFNVGDDWFITIGATIHTKPLFGKSKS